MKVQKATIDDYDEIIYLLDNEFSTAGFGFVNREQVKTEIYKGRVCICKSVVGVRIGTKTLWNMVVAKAFQKLGIGSRLFKIVEPEKIRCKCNPVGHLSKKQEKEFIDPTEFYEKMGYKETGFVKGKNYWAGSTKEGKRIFVAEGEKEHIKIMQKPEDLLFEL